MNWRKAERFLIQFNVVAYITVVAFWVVAVWLIVQRLMGEAVPTEPSLSELCIMVYSGLVLVLLGVNLARDVREVRKN